MRMKVGALLATLALLAPSGLVAATPGQAAVAAHASHAKAAKMKAALRGFTRTVDKAEGMVDYWWIGATDSGMLAIGIGVEKNRRESATKGIILATKFNNGSCIAPVKLSFAADGRHFRYRLPISNTDCPLEHGSFIDAVSWGMDDRANGFDVMPFRDYRKIAHAKHVNITFTGFVGDVKTFTVSPEVLRVMRDSITGAGW